MGSTSVNLVKSLNENTEVEVKKKVLTEASFNDKVKAIKKSLKKKDGRISNKSAEEQAKKIAGSMIKNESSMDDKVTVEIYGEKKEFNTRAEAIEFFKDCANNSEGSEQERYLDVLYRLKYGHDKELKDIDESVKDELEFNKVPDEELEREIKSAQSIEELKDKLALLNDENKYLATIKDLNRMVDKFGEDKVNNSLGIIKNRVLEIIRNINESDTSAKEMSVEEIDKVIETREPKGTFYAKDNDGYVAVDNTDGNAWTEDFKSKEDAIKWLSDKSEVKESDIEEVKVKSVEKGLLEPEALNEDEKLWCGVPGVKHIWHGSWSDPQVEYKGLLYNEWDLQEMLPEELDLNNITEDDYDTVYGELEDMRADEIAEWVYDDLNNAVSFEDLRNKIAKLKETTLIPEKLLNEIERMASKIAYDQDDAYDEDDRLNELLPEIIETLQQGIKADNIYESAEENTDYSEDIEWLQEPIADHNGHTLYKSIKSMSIDGVDYASYLERDAEGNGVRSFILPITGTEDIRAEKRLKESENPDKEKERSQEDLSYIDSDCNSCRVYYAVNTSGYKTLGIVVNDKDKKFQVVFGQQLAPGHKTAKRSKKQIWDMREDLIEKGYEEIKGPSSPAGVFESVRLKESEELIEEEKVSDKLTELKSQGNVYMLQDDEKYIVGVDYDKSEGIINDAEIYNNKEDADQDYFARCEVKRDGEDVNPTE